MSKRRQTHILKTADRTFTATVQECRDHVKIDARASKYASWTDRDEEQAWGKWMLKIISRYGNDPRPIVTRHPLTGHAAVVGGSDRDGAICAIITPL